MSKPLATIMTWDDATWEEFIHDWLIECRSLDYVAHERLGGAGDKGRDIVGFITDPHKKDYIWHNYQCKFYANRLSFSDVIVEFGKLIFFTKSGDFPVPEKYYFVAPKDLSTAFSELLRDSNLLKTKILDVWDESISKKITSKRSILLTQDLSDYINNFNFNIFYSLPLSKILNDITKTPLYFKYFGEIFYAREFPAVAPVYDPSIESVYVGQLLNIYSEVSPSKDINLANLGMPFNNHFRGCRNDFYFASSLSRYMRDSFIEDNFKILKSYISSSIESVLYKIHINSFDRCNDILNQASLTNISHPVLSKICEVPDKKGICHHMINDGEL
ncbi:ABC-three component system protein, partial [Yersinia kristensenii]|uniref:ABC-three component system protein n=1 Tax=Yersinia kristensenii TaxID=28152 RepID=UPI0011A2D526